MRTDRVFRTPVTVGLLVTLMMGVGLAAPAQDASIVLTEDGAWGYNGPHAVVSDGQLFWSYIDSEGIVWAASRDVESGATHAAPVWETYADLHQASSLFVRPDGRIQLFVNRDGVYTEDGILWKVSAAPGDITEFAELQESIEVGMGQGRQFYPMVHEATGDVYLILNASTEDGNRRIGLWKSIDGGDSFREHHLLYGLADDLAANRSYTRAYIHEDQIHLVAVRVGWNEAVDEYPIGRIEGVYYIKYDINEETFHRANGEISFTLKDTPIHGVEYFDRIWCWQEDGGGQQRTLWSDIVTDETGRPYVAFAVQDAVPQGESKTHDGYWAAPDENGVWRHHRVTELARGWDNTPERVNHAIAIDPDDPRTVFVAQSTDAEADMSQVRRMITEDDGKTWRSVETLSEEGRITTVVVPRRTDDTPRPFDVLWLEGRMEGWRDYHTRIVTRAANTP